VDTQSGPPAARVDAVTDTFFGTTVEDPYRWMEEWNAPEARAWLEAQAAHSRRVLDAVPERAELLARISELSEAGSTASDIRVANGRVFYLRRDPGENVFKLVAHLSPGEPARVLVDPNVTVDGGGHFAIDWYSPSNDGRRVAYGLSRSGSEDSVLHVVETDPGEAHELAITRTRWNEVVWLEDNRSFLYTRFPELAPDAPPMEHFLNNRLYLHRLGDDPEGDTLVLGRGSHPAVAVAPEDSTYIHLSRRSPWMLAVVIHGVLKEMTVYVAPRAALADPPSVPWTKVADVDDGVTGFDLDGETVYLKTHGGSSGDPAPRFRVVAVPAAAPDLASARVVVPPSEAVVRAIRVAGDYLLVKDLDGGISRLRRVPLAGGEPEPIPLPVKGTVLDWGGDEESDELFVQLVSWTSPPAIYRVNAAARTVEDTGWLPPSPVDFGDVETHEVFARSKDGTLVPLSIVHRKGLALDGHNPTLLTGYGSYGYPYEPSFRPTMLAWYERGGVYALAHVRGGGEYGNEWHEGGKLLNKQNTIDDFVACAEYLVEKGYTRPGLIAGAGRSAGGVVAGGGIVARPDLWGAMCFLVADVNAFRSEFSEGGPANIPEFGSVTTEEGFRALEIIDAYSKIRDGVAYPAAFLSTGVNDPRVPPWQSMKMAARLQAASSSGRPVLLRVDFEGGHGMGSTRAQLDEELADQLAFLVWQLR
jgi:prolyl oligopeptidase